MSSQSSNIANTDFLECCINKKKSFEDIYESLGLFSEARGKRKSPVFPREEANKMHKRIKEMAGSFRVSRRNNRDKLLSDLAKEGVLAREIEELGLGYGAILWGEESVSEELKWDKQANQEVIRFYMRCWITRYAVESTMPRKGKGRAGAITRDISESEQSEHEHSEMSLYQNGVGIEPLHHASQVLDVIPVTSSSRIELMVGRPRQPDKDNSIANSLKVVRSPITPNKRKAFHFQGSSGSGKLQKVVKATPAATLSSRPGLRDMWSVPKSPTPASPLLPTNLEPQQCREYICNTEGTSQQLRETRFESETVFDPDEVMANTQEIIWDGLITFHDNSIRSPVAVPLGSHQHSQTQPSERQDSVIPYNIQHNTEQSEIDQNLHCQDDAQLISTQLVHHMSHSHVSRLEYWQERKLRTELYKLLISFLNGINQFDSEAYEPLAEERMDNLLRQFWDHDADRLRSEVGENIMRLQAAWGHWMDMRIVLKKFQRDAGYIGKPGDDWKAELRRMGRVPRAQASIAFVDLKMKSGLMIDECVLQVDPTFDDDLKIIFDLLTQVDGCNGIEEFAALSLYNKGLLEWFY
ncbi:hypothetical protein GQ44DRAFT_757878 [Phaeosphaeriaceae sp. PMI808]|nr:hypothetical protein GQ44DRAFT_757878 [Phaeosphaeriaceae sp. PMI808]